MTAPSVIVIGAGFGGLGVAHELRRHGLADVLVLERADDIGGVWRENTYPGAACDVPSTLYSWSFAPNPEWGHRYSRQPEILDYIHDTADRLGLRALVRTGVEVEAASYDEQAHRWRVRSTAGEEFEADVLVSAVGQLSRPVVPAIPGREAFAGPAFHSAEWDHDVDLTGQRVAVVGTGASAIQFVPAIADQVKSLEVFQRSAPYVVPKPDRTYTRAHSATFSRLPRTQAVGRRLTFRLTELFNNSFTHTSLVKKGLHAAWRLQLRRHIKDPDLRSRLEPDYPMGCKRVLFSNDWYPALAREHVDVVTDRVTTIEPGGLRTEDGALHEADVIIWGTGFAATDFLAPMTVTGAGGRDLHAEWRDGARAHLGITVPHFPNLFLVYGPNTNLGGSSIIGMMEAQAGYIRQAVQALGAGRPALEVRADVAGRYDDEMQDRLGDSVWAECTSWYRDGGRITTNWPGLVAEYQQRTARFDPADFVDAADVVDQADVVDA